MKQYDDTVEERIELAAFMIDACRSHANGRACLTYQEVAEFCECSEADAQRTIGKLIRRKVLRRVAGAVYQVDHQRLEEIPHPGERPLRRLLWSLAGHLYLAGLTEPQVRELLAEVNEVPKLGTTLDASDVQTLARQRRQALRIAGKVA